MTEPLEALALPKAVLVSLFLLDKVVVVVATASGLPAAVVALVEVVGVAVSEPQVVFFELHEEQVA